MKTPGVFWILCNRGREKERKKEIKGSDNTTIKMADAECNMYCKIIYQSKANVLTGKMFSLNSNKI